MEASIVNFAEEVGSGMSQSSSPETVSNIRNRAIEVLRIRHDYLPEWNAREAFRECYQNWRDGILRSYGLQLSEFRTEWSHVDRIILIRVFRPRTRDLLGYIRFQYDSNEHCVGGVHMVNFNASIDLPHLDMGGSTKVEDSEQAGQYGEGLKLAALVFRRCGYSFLIESNSFKWNFIYHKRKLACSLTRMSDANLQKLRHAARGSQRTIEAHAWEDVSVIIGAAGVARTADGDQVAGAKISLTDFRLWLQVTLDINPPGAIIRTSSGDLIRDPLYRGQMYLKGLLLAGSSEVDAYEKGYNFKRGKTSRDRGSLVSPREENRQIDSIWAAAIRKDKTTDSEILAEYTTLLMNPQNDKSDTALSHDRKSLPQDIVTKIWRQLLVTNSSEDGRKPFYYPSSDGESVLYIIETSFQLQPMPIPIGLWRMLRKYELCRTPQEELQHRFSAADMTTVPHDDFAAHVVSMLQQLLLASSETENMKICFVDGKALAMDAALFDDTWRIHDKWLSREGSHQDSYCDMDNLSEETSFKCDHVVLQLWDIMFALLQANKKYAGIGKRGAFLKGMANARIRQMPRSVKCHQTRGTGELHVSWTSEDSRQNDDEPVKIVLHDATCQVRPDSKDKKCACTSKSSDMFSDGVIFCGLRPCSTYRASVCRDSENAFVAYSLHEASPRCVPVPARRKRSSSPQSYVLGEPVNSSDLIQIYGRPADFDFHYTSNAPRENVYIAKRKVQPLTLSETIKKQRLE